MESHSEPQPATTPPRKKAVPRVSFALIALILVLVLNFSVAAGWAVDHESRTNPEFCSNCHIMNRYVQTYQAENYMASIHREANVGCKDCHSNYSIGDELTSGFNYLTGNYDEVLIPRKFDDEMCTQCHISLEYHAARTDFLTRNPHMSHWPELRCTNCHISHDDQVNYCSRCHENGGQRMTGEPITPRAHNPWAEATSEDLPAVSVQ